MAHQVSTSLPRTNIIKMVKMVPGQIARITSVGKTAYSAAGLYVFCSWCLPGVKGWNRLDNGSHWESDIAEEYEVELLPNGTKLEIIIGS